MDPATWLAHAGTSAEPGEPLVPPIVAAAVFGSAGIPDPDALHYARDGQPTWQPFEEALGGLEDAQCAVFASGQAATMAVILSLSGDRPRLVLPADGYYQARRLAEMLPGVEPVFVDLAQTKAVAAALAERPAVLWVETPTNPLLRVFDIRELAEVAAEHGAPVIVDNTTATAVLQRPLDLGATACVYSVTKAASGHHDLILGAVTTRDPQLVDTVRSWRKAGGGIAGPFETWLALRGLRTLPLRIVRQSATALRVAQWLATHPRVRQVHYPGLADDTARKQMSGGFGPLLSFELDADVGATDAVIAAARVVQPATSFGGLGSTWERRARWASETAPASLIRLSIGLEDPDDLIADIRTALDTP